MKNLIYLILTVVIWASCSEVNDPKGDKEVNTSSRNVIKQSQLYKGSSKYSKIFHTEKPLIGYSTLKENPLAENELSIINHSYVNNLKSQEIKSTGKNIEIYANGICLTALNKIENKRERLKSSQSSLYGTNVTFKFTNWKSATMGTSENEKDTTITMYVPEIVAITSPKIETTQELFPYCYFEDFTIKWNADEINKNGLVVLFEWYGVTLDGKKENTYTRNIDIIETDDGMATLNDKLFDNIPHNAIAYITLLRGNVEIIENQLTDESYRLAAESHAVLPFVLIREY